MEDPITGPQSSRSIFQPHRASRLRTRRDGHQPRRPRWCARRSRCISVYHCIPCSSSRPRAPSSPASIREQSLCASFSRTAISASALSKAWTARWSSSTEPSTRYGAAEKSRKPRRRRWRRLPSSPASRPGPMSRSVPSPICTSWRRAATGRAPPTTYSSRSAWTDGLIASALGW